MWCSITWRLACPGRRLLFRGSIGRSDLPRGNQADLIRSIVTELWPLGPEVTFVPGHGPLSTFGRERRDNPYVADAVLTAKS
jgi:hydroxyacylglutathione hydrolase